MRYLLTDLRFPGLIVLVQCRDVRELPLSSAYVRWGTVPLFYAVRSIRDRHQVRLRDQTLAKNHIGFDRFVKHVGSRARVYETNGSFVFDVAMNLGNQSVFRSHESQAVGLRQASSGTSDVYVSRFCPFSILLLCFHISKSDVFGTQN